MAINKNSEYVINFVKNRKQNLISVFGNKCCICGFNSYPEALDFHHVNPEEKEFPLSSNVMKSLEKQLKEAKKCILVCANCHRGIHAGYIEIPKNYKDFFNQERANKLISINEEIKYGKKHYCCDCGKIISKDAVRCAECASKSSRVVNRPNREELKQLIRNKPFTQIAKQYGVSDNAIRNWCESECLPSKKTEIKKYSDIEWEKI